MDGVAVSGAIPSRNKRRKSVGGTAISPPAFRVLQNAAGRAG
jgi:hypothetical protein